MTTDELNARSVADFLAQARPVEFTESMNEISGFGGSYERGCRCAVIAGAKWLREHPQAKPSFKSWADVFGLIEGNNEDARALTHAIESATFTMDDGRKVHLGNEMTGAMFHAAVNHILFIAEHGWDDYVQKMSAPFKLEAAEDDAE